MTTLAKDPASLDSRWARLRTLTVGKDEHTVPSASVLRVVGELGWCLEVGATSTNSFDFRVGSLLPFDHILFIDGVVEGEDGDRDPLRQRGEFAEECRQHPV